MKKKYIVPITLVVEMEAETMMASSAPDPDATYDTTVTISDEAGEIWSLGGDNSMWDEDWGE